MSGSTKSAGTQSYVFVDGVSGAAPKAKSYGSFGNTGKSATQSSDTGTLLAQRYAKRGYSAWAIANIMSQNGYSDKEISDALEKAGVE